LGDAAREHAKQTGRGNQECAQGKAGEQHRIRTRAGHAV
jgi:hypothetical protein